jgi:hypothetical protein
MNINESYYDLRIFGIIKPRKGLNVLNLVRSARIIKIHPTQPRMGLNVKETIL